MDIPRGAQDAPHQCIEKLLSGRLVNAKCGGANFTLDPTCSRCPPRRATRRRTQRARGLRTASTVTKSQQPSTSHRWRQTATSRERTQQLAPDGLSWMLTCSLFAATWHGFLRPRLSNVPAVIPPWKLWRERTRHSNPRRQRRRSNCHERCCDERCCDATRSRRRLGHCRPDGRI